MMNKDVNKNITFDGNDNVGVVNILDTKQLFMLAQDKTEAGRCSLAQGISDFFEQKLTENERSLAGEILVNLIRQAELDLRQILAERLSTKENVPPDLIVYLANDELSVAEPVLLHSPVLSDIDLVFIVRSKPASYWQTIARRERITPVLADTLILTEDSTTVLNLIDNDKINLNKGSMKKLARVAMRNEALQQPLLSRPEIDSDVAIDLYMCVSQALRKDILGRFNINSADIERSLDHLVQELTDAAHGKKEATPEMIEIAKRFSERGEITSDLLIKTLRRGQMGFFIALLSERLSLEPMTIVRLVEKEGGKPLAIACKAMGVLKSEFASIFLLSRGVRSGDKIVDQRELAMALKCYDSVRPNDVQSILKSWAKDPKMI